MRSAIFPGSFDPFTLGHKNVLDRSLKIFDTVFVAVMINPSKNPFLPKEIRIQALENFSKSYGNRVQVIGFEGLLVELCTKLNCFLIIRSFRSVTDLELELQRATANKELCPDIETFFIPASSETAHISSSLVRELLFFKKNWEKFVPSDIVPTIAKWLNSGFSGNE